MEEKREQHRDPQGSSSSADAAGPGDGSERDEAVGEGGDKEKEEKEKQEEEAFLVSLYKFMKERRTPIERIPHLGFKQINLWKIYKAVEKLGAYELVTGRRLWKNVYDELGGSPGSTSAATCTRRHYERLVLPYVRHLKGEEDKPLPASKPRRQYKVSREDRSKRPRKEKGREQEARGAPQEGPRPLRALPGPARLREPGREGGMGSREPPATAPALCSQPAPDEEDAAERGRGTHGRCSPASPAPSASGGCPGPCRSHGDTYKRLFSSFYSKGNHPIMSPLAKKKLLAQVSKAESLRCHKRPEGRRAASGPELSRAGRRSPEPPAAPDRAPDGAVGSEASPRAEDGGPAPAVFTGYFHAYRGEGLCPPLWGHLAGLKDLLEPPSAWPEPEQPPEARGRAAGPPCEGRAAAVQACWVPPGAALGRGRPGDEEEDEDDDDEEDEESHAASPSAEESVDRAARSPGGHRGLAKPKAVVASAGLDALQGAALHFPGGFGGPLEHLQTQGVPLAPALAVNPLVIPAFPSPLVVATEPCRPLATRLPASFSLYPAAPWHGQHGRP